MSSHDFTADDVPIDLSVRKKTSPSITDRHHGDIRESLPSYLFPHNLPSHYPRQREDHESFLRQLAFRYIFFNQPLQNPNYLNNFLPILGGGHSPESDHHHVHHVHHERRASLTPPSTSTVTNRNVIPLSTICKSSSLETSSASDKLLSSPSVSSNNLLRDASADKKKISRPLTGRYVRHGNGASPSTLLALKRMIEERQQRKLTRGPQPNSKRNSKGRTIRRSNFS